ncbi:hypothetical protein CBS101457_005704 [Exobasidium rhododendri]|nr:hypothetical protein CBS101457_005704 [Exobasidium rhododendri]
MSGVCLQLRSITMSTTFRARYFVSRSMPCQAIYRASCRSKIFTPELIKCMLSQGAILSRYFAQAVYQRLSNQFRLRSNARWGQAIDSLAIHQIFIEAHRQYGNTFKYSSMSTDSNEVRSWAVDGSRRNTLTDEIREIFVYGKFSIFSGEDSNFSCFSELSSVIALHPEVLGYFRTNGYEYTKWDQGRIVQAILLSKNSPEEVYNRLDALLIEYPDWIMTAVNTDVEDQLQKPWFSSTSPVSLENANSIMLSDEGETTPINNAVKVMKRLHDEGRAFTDLKKLVVTALQDFQAHDQYCKPSDHAPALRILLKLFPSLLGKYKIYAATVFACAFQIVASKASPTAVQRGHKKLFQLFDELELDASELALVLSSDRFSYDKLIMHAVEDASVSQLRGVDGREFLQGVIESCLYLPMSGHRVEEVELAMKELTSSRKTPLNRAMEANRMLVEGLSEALMMWQFDLETLQPDRKLDTEHKFRTPIAWMARGTFVRNNQGHYNHPFASLADIHGLFPYRSRPRQSNDSIDLTFASMPSLYDEQEEQRPSVHGKNRRDESEVQDKGKDREEDGPAVKDAGKTKETTTGWRHLGHIDELAKRKDGKEGLASMDVTLRGIMGGDDAVMADDSGVFFGDESEKEDEVATPVQLVVEASDEETDDTEEGPKKLPTNGKIGHFPAIVMRVLRSHCSSCLAGHQNHCYGFALPFDAKAIELADVLPKYLSPTSSALRDVVLAHALVNGNEDIARSLLEGEWEGKEGKPSTAKMTNLVKAREGAPEQPVAPTLAHLRILQAIDRKPMGVFVTAILRGAPFKRGFVKSSLPSRRKESDWKLRDEWSKKKGKKDDRPLEILFEEKNRLEKMDRSAKRHKNQRKKEITSGSDLFSPGEGGGRVAAVAAAAATLEEEASSATGSIASRRAHLSRSARKPVRYAEDHVLTSEDEGVEDGEEGGVGEGVAMKQTKTHRESSRSSGSQKKEKKSEDVQGSTVNVVKKVTMEGDGILDDGSELSEPSEPNEVRREEEDEEEEINDDSETDSEEEEDSRLKQDVYRLYDKDDLPLVTYTLESTGEVTVALHELQRRCRSLQLWLEHVTLLLWFEKRKDSIAKEKVAKAREAGQRGEQWSRSVFSKSIQKVVKMMEVQLEVMQSTLATALSERKTAIKKKNEAKTTVTATKKRKQAERAKTKVKTEEDALDATLAVESSPGRGQKRAKKDGDGKTSSRAKRGKK